MSYYFWTHLHMQPIDTIFFETKVEYLKQHLKKLTIVAKLIYLQ